jgi:arylsulfatase A-like enzyme
LPESATTLAERARERGFQTAAFVAAVVLADDFGLDQGFEVYDQPTPPLVQTERHYDRRRAGEVADAAVAWIDGLDPERPFFAWAHFFDPHLPYEPEPEFVAQVGGSGYHAEVAAMDHAIGRILDALARRGLDDETLIVVVADHGESLGEHDEETHGALAYDAVIRVPMIVRDPGGHRAGERSDEVVSVVDVYPTLVEALELGGSGDVDGISLFRRTVPADRGVYFETYYGFLSFHWSPVVGWADREGKYLHSSAPEYYATPSDPRELENVIAAQPAERLERYRRGIEALAARPSLARTDDDAASAAVIEGLQALGYTGAGGGAIGLPPPLSDTGLPSPAAMQANYRLLQAAQDLSGAQRWDEAIVLLRRVLDANPRNAAAWFQLGAALIGAGEHEESLAATRRNLELGHRWYGPLRNLALAYEHLQRPEEALAAYAEALETGPYLMDVLQRCVELAEALGRKEDANLYRRKLIEAREAEASRGG